MFTHSPAHTDLLTCDVSYAHGPDILHIDPTFLLRLEDREIVYRVATHLENLEKSVNSKVVKGKIRENEKKNQEKLKSV